MINKTFLLGTFLLGFFSFSQNVEKKQDPAWVKALSQEKVNYYQAVQDFHNYWKEKEKPEEEEMLFNKDEQSKKKSRVKNIEYDFEYKKFKNWMINNESFIKEDGTVMTEEEKQNLWREEMQNRNKKTN